MVALTVGHLAALRAVCWADWTVVLWAGKSAGYLAVVKADW
jgi:hypothetical protein